MPACRVRGVLAWWALGAPSAPVCLPKLVHMLRAAAPPPPSPADEQFDDFLGMGTGAAALFGTTGGVMEAALR